MRSMRGAERGTNLGGVHDMSRITISFWGIREACRAKAREFLEALDAGLKACSHPQGLLHLLVSRRSARFARSTAEAAVPTSTDRNLPEDLLAVTETPNGAQFR
jgi:hypothetical protein